MARYHYRLDLEQVSQWEKESLTEKCQENGWLRRGGYDWQDDPWLEDYLYDFVRAKNLDDLRSFFSHGNWAIRQGVLFRDLAFVQQVNGGDEWWTLKRDGENWVAFESWSFGNISEDLMRFSRAITSMEMATPEQCRRLEYMMKDNNLIWESGYTHDVNWAGDEVRCRWFSGDDGLFRIDVYERPSYPGYTAELFSKEDRSMLCRETGIDNALDAADLAIAKYIKTTLPMKIRSTKEIERSVLASRADAARDAARAMGEERLRGEMQKQAR